MEYFAQVKTFQVATKHYSALAKKWHPDRNGSIDARLVMAEINRLYKEVIVTPDSERSSGNAADSCENQDTGLKRNVTEPEIHSAPKNRTGTQACEHTQTCKSRWSRAKAFVRTYISDRDVERIGDAREEVISNTAKTMIAMGTSAFSHWKRAELHRHRSLSCNRIIK
jgi:hypothetical protein